MDALAGATRLTSLNGVEGLGELFRGGQTEASIQEKGLGKNEMAVVVTRLLRRSEATMTQLNLRCALYFHPTGIAGESI